MYALRFAAFEEHTDLVHGFSLRWHPDHVEALDAEAALEPLGVECHRLVTAEQPHGNRVAVVRSSHAGSMVRDVDALVTDAAGLVLVIRCADCGPLFLFNPVRRVVGLAHSGRKGTELQIASATIQSMLENFGGRAGDIIALLGPCIRPPDYESDFAAEIAKQCRESGVGVFHDCGLNTAADAQQFYSYRRERGKTGRHYAFMGLVDS